jgi:CheY-like chemotaxis protein
MKKAPPGGFTWRSGIPADVLPRVFDPFFSTKKGGKGSGLGLAQVHGFVHQSGGAATVDSNLGRGTRVTLYFPRASDERAKAEDESAAAMAGTGTVLLVEGNPDVASATQAMLEQLGYRVRVASNADEALAALKQPGIDLMISDIVMPGAMNGLALAREARKTYPNLPILLVSGYSEVSATAAEEFNLLRKPYDLGELSRTAAALIARARPAPHNLVELHAMRSLRDSSPKS